MDTGDIAFIILLSLPLVMWIGGEIRFRKSKDAKWIKKARGISQSKNIIIVQLHGDIITLKIIICWVRF